MTQANLGFQHRYVASRLGPEEDGGHRRTLLLLHGTGGTEDDLIELGAALDPAANLLSPRGKVLEQGMPRFFRRFAEGVFDEADLVTRTHELADFVISAGGRYGFDLAHVVAAGYSNGANIAVGLLLLRPQLLVGAILFRALLPLAQPPQAELKGRRVFLSEGEYDPIITAAEGERLAAQLQEAGATVELRRWPAGHQLTATEIAAAHSWLAGWA
jgi:phospholipase/carboxylesterase